MKRGKRGTLSEPIYRQSYSVVVLDEIEKAHPSVRELIMIISQQGVLQDSESRHIDFSNTIIIMNSNAYSDVLVELYEQGESDPAKLFESVKPHLQYLLTPSFLGNLKPVVFLPRDGLTSTESG